MSFAAFVLLLVAGIFGATYEAPTNAASATPLPTLIDDTATSLPIPAVNPTETVQAAESLALVLKNSQFVMLRTAPTTNSSVATRVPPGVTVTILRKESGDLTDPTPPWYYVRLPDGTQGWIRSDMVNVFWPPAPTNTPEPTISAPRSVSWNAGTRLIVNNPNGVWLRRSPTSGAAQVATLAFQNLATATGKKHFDGLRWWWEVRADWGAVGWVEQVSLSPA